VIGVDTNVLVRLFVIDNAGQTEKARAFIDARTADDPAFVSLVALLEFFWVLKSSYGYPRSAIIGAVRTMLDSANVVLEHEDSVRHLVQSHAETDADVADVLISQVGVSARCRTVVTFDKNAAKRIPEMDLLS
jgi:predicted nucleic-acid-binding protein